MLHNICVGTILYDVLTDAVSLPRIPVGRKKWDSYAGSSSPTILTRTFWVSPSEQTALQINVLLLRPYRSLSHQISMIIAASFQIDHVVWIKDRKCHWKKKRVKRHGKLFEVSLTPIDPPVPPHAPRPTVGQRRNAVQRFCRMSR